MYELFMGWQLFTFYLSLKSCFLITNHISSIIYFFPTPRFLCILRNYLSTIVVESTYLCIASLFFFHIH